MARYTGPVWKKSRRLHFSVLETGKELNKRDFAPGQHGQARKKDTEYGAQLAEKQKVRYVYGLTEKQFRKTFDEAKKIRTGKQGANFLILLESRLDNLVYRAGFAKTRKQARQLVSHGHVTLDGKKADIPSIRVKVGQVVSLKEKAKELQVVKDSVEATLARVPYVEFDAEKLEAKFIRLPEREEFLPEIKENLIVEFYNR
jgi:small subunit ribosomal protein S4